MINIRYAQIRSMDVSNGEGIGIALFVQGCHFHCYNCFNSETWDFKGGKEWTKNIENEFINLINKPYINRISILGGEPLSSENTDCILKLVRKIKLLFPQNHIWLYSGYTWDEIFYDGLHKKELSHEEQIRKEIVLLSDIFVDGKYIDSQKDITLLYRGSRNQRIIDVKRTSEKGEIVLWTT